MTDVLESHLERLVNPIDDSDWLDVQRRVRGMRRPRRVIAFAAGIAAAAVLAVPAFGVGGRLLDLIDGSPAPPEVKTYFAADNQSRQQLFAAAAAAGQVLRDRYAQVSPEGARGIAAIESADGPIYLWAAPTTDGRQCWLIQAGSEAATGRPYGLGACDGASPTASMATGTFWTAERPNVQIVHARVYDAAIVSVEALLADSGPLTLPVVSGHALGTIAKGNRVEAFVGRNAAGDEVARVGQAG